MINTTVSPDFIEQHLEECFEWMKGIFDSGANLHDFAYYEWQGKKYVPSEFVKRIEFLKGKAKRARKQANIDAYENEYYSMQEDGELVYTHKAYYEVSRELADVLNKAGQVVLSVNGCSIWPRKLGDFIPDEIEDCPIVQEAEKAIKARQKVIINLSYTVDDGDITPNVEHLGRFVPVFQCSYWENTRTGETVYLNNIEQKAYSFPYEASWEVNCLASEENKYRRKIEEKISELIEHQRTIMQTLEDCEKYFLK